MYTLFFYPKISFGFSRFVPSGASVLTLKESNRADVFLWVHALRPDEQTLTKFLKNDGYQAGFFANSLHGSIIRGIIKF